MERHALLRMGGCSLKASPQNAAGTTCLSYYKFYPAAFSIGGEAKRAIHLTGVWRANKIRREKLFSL